MTERTPPRPAWLRFGAVFVALFALLGVGHVLPALHLGLVAHRVCSEHGELLHSNGSSALVVHAPPSGGSEPSAEDGSEHEHEHCGVLALGGSVGALEMVRGSASILPAAWATRLPGCARVAHVEIALLLYAPKLAPPA